MKERLLEKIESTSTLTEMDYLCFRPLFSENCSATLSDIYDQDLKTVLKLNEYIDIQEALVEQERKEEEARQPRPIGR